MTSSNCITPRKCCTKCGNEYPATTEYFATTKRLKSGLTAECRTCLAARAHEFRQKRRSRTDEQIDAERAEYQRKHPIKTCRGCNRELPSTLEYFYANKVLKSGLTARCRDCIRQEIHDKRVEDPEPHRAAARKYYYGHKEQCAVRSAKWQRENPDKVRASTKRWMNANPDKVLATRRAWEATNHDKLLEQKRAWRAANPDVARAQWQRRYARKKTAQGRATAEDLAAIRAAQTDKQGRLICWYCGKPITGRPHLDHWIPLLEDGTHEPGNLHYMHAKCNQSKGGKHPTELGRLL